MENKNNIICHHGIKGQKWGVQRYHNPDGSLTKEGQKQYLKESKESGKNKGAIVGAVVGGSTAGGIAIAKMVRTKDVVDSNTPAKLTAMIGRSIVKGLLLGTISGLVAGKTLGKKKGKAELADYGKQYVTQTFNGKPDGRVVEQLPQTNLPKEDEKKKK